MPELKTLYKKAVSILKRAGVDSPEYDAFELLCAVYPISKAEFLTSGEDISVSHEQAAHYHSLVMDRARRVPLQHITGMAHFYGREFSVNGNVLVPRPDTEILVEEALKVIDKDDRVLDICTGSGCILIALDIGAENKTGVFNFRNGVGTDISEAALKVARNNAEKLSADNISFIQGDLFENVEGVFDVIVSNPPYIEREEIKGLQPEVRDFDPVIALDGGEDGLVFYRRIIARLPFFLKKGGYIFFETGYDQGRKVSELLKKEGFKDVHIIKDYGGNDRVVRAVSE